MKTIVFDHKINSGEKEYFTIPVGELAHRATVTIPVIVVAGTESGPTLWINGTVHGDELNGSYGAWELSREIDPKAFNGVLIITPIANPLAFECRNKISSIDSMDMDTAFPGDPEGLFTQRIAHILYKEIKKHANALINFHTMASPYKANPYSVRKLVPGVDAKVNAIAEGMQRAFGVVANCCVDLSGKTEELPGVTSGALDITCLKDGIPAFMGEMGQGGKIERPYVDMAKMGILNVMKYLGMMEGACVRPNHQILITQRRFLRISQGGFVTMQIAPGDIVRKGTSILDIHYYGKEVGKVNAESDYYIIGTRENPVVNTGDRIAFVGTAWHEWTET